MQFNNGCLTTWQAEYQTWCHGMLEEFENSDSCPVSDTAMGDKTWPYQFEPETECQTTMRSFANDILPVKVRTPRSVGKIITQNWKYYYCTVVHKSFKKCHQNTPGLLLTVPLWASVLIITSFSLIKSHYIQILCIKHNQKLNKPRTFTTNFSAAIWFNVVMFHHCYQSTLGNSLHKTHLKVQLYFYCLLYTTFLALTLVEYSYLFPYFEQYSGQYHLTDQ